MEPRWLQEKRSKASKLEVSLPIPTQEEYWRKTNFSRIPLAKYSPVAATKNGAAAGSASAFLPLKLLLAGEILYGEETSPVTLDPQLQKQGVILAPLSQATLQHEDLVLKYLGRGFEGRGEKFIAQNEAGWQTGVFCYVPKNVQIELPLLLTQHFSGDDKTLFPRVLVVLEAGAKATLLHYAFSAAEKNNHEVTPSGFVNSLSEVYLSEGSTLTLIDLQDLSKKTAEVATKRVEVGKNATLKWILNIEGAKISKTDIETVLNGEGARAEVMGLVLAKEKQHLELCSLTQHVTPHTSADILIKSTADDQAKTIFQGMIRIEKEAQQTESYMANHNLVLSDKAHADSIPRLEIEADDVKASHGATVGQIDHEQIFYLKSRGLSKEVAERLLVEGFYEDIFGRIPLEEVRELLRKKVLYHAV